MSQGKRQRRSFYQAVLAASWSGFVPGNQITLLANGAACSPAIEAAIDRAGQEVYLEAYIFTRMTPPDSGSRTR
jgi:phosphatidylserine/phosphatidylglycerophosphate/cardiolipin synthase-like enzyme